MWNKKYEIKCKTKQNKTIPFCLPYIILPPTLFYVVFSQISMHIFFIHKMAVNLTYLDGLHFLPMLKKHFISMLIFLFCVSLLKQT